MNLSAFPPLIWLDLEMSGLDPETCTILEIATIVTDGELNTIAEGPNIIIHQADSVLAAMDSWCQQQHGGSGLTELVRNSTISLSESEQQTLQFLQQYCLPGKSPLCGNSVSHDRRFIIKYMPDLARFLHYRTIDVSSCKELCIRWYPAIVPPAKRETHRALDDIRESIHELRFYRQHCFRSA